ncbi:MAG TPA: FAD-dependent oxidoreductase [Coriobacteriia bacterium]
MGADSWHVAFDVFLECGPGTGIFRFDRPGEYTFQAGQFFTLSLETREGPQTKTFSHAEAPADPYIELATRLTGSAFKDALLALRPGDEVEVAGPGGRMTLPADVRKAAFLVGGVGITPARSIIRDAVQRASGLSVALFYGNQDQTCIPFGEELTGYASSHAGIEVVDVLAAPNAGWSGETGFITAPLVRRHLDPLDGWHWFVCGPPAMVGAMERVVAELGLPSDSVSWERFSGYA